MSPSSSPRCPHFPSPCPPSFFNLGICASSHHISKPPIRPKQLVCGAEALSTPQSSLFDTLGSGVAAPQFHNDKFQRPYYAQANTNTDKLENITPRWLHCGGSSEKAVAVAATVLPSKLSSSEATHASHHKLLSFYAPSLISHSSLMKKPIMHSGYDHPKLSFKEIDDKFNDVKPSFKFGYGDAKSSKYPTRLGLGDFEDAKPFSFKLTHGPHSMHTKPPPLPLPPLKPTSLPPSYSPTIRIVHIKAPKVIKTDAASFRSLVQKLTGKSSKKSKKFKVNKPKASPAPACSSAQASPPTATDPSCLSASFAPAAWADDMSTKVEAHKKGVQEVDCEGGKSMTSCIQENYEKYLHIPASTSYAREQPSLMRRPEAPKLNTWKYPFWQTESFDEAQPSPSSSVTSLGVNSRSTLSSPTESNGSWEGASSVEEPKFTEWDIVWGLFAAVPSHVLELAQLPPLPLPSSNFEENTPKEPQTQAIWRFPQLLS